MRTLKAHLTTLHLISSFQFDNSRWRMLLVHFEYLSLSLSLHKEEEGHRLLTITMITIVDTKAKA